MPIIYLILSFLFAFSLSAQQVIPDLPLITLQYSLKDSAPAGSILIGVRNFAGPGVPLSFTVKPSATTQNWLRVAAVSSLADTSDSCPADPGSYVAFPGSLAANTKDNKLCITAARTEGVPGNYSGFLTLTPSGGNPAQVIVNLNVVPGSSLLLTPDVGTAFNENILQFGSAAGPAYLQTVKVEIADPANPAVKIAAPISYSLRPDANPIDWLSVQCLQQDRKTPCGANPTTPVYFQVSIGPASSSGQVVAKIDIGSLNASFPGNDVITVLANVSAGSLGTPSSISGQVKITGGAGLAGVLISLSNGMTAATDGSGNFSFSTLTAGTGYSITPSLSGYAFTPASATIGSLSGAQTVGFTAAATSPPSGNPLSDSAFVTRLYLYILGRPPETDGLAFWLGRLSRGDDTRAGVADKFLSSAEYAKYGLFIVSNYLGILGREPEIDGYQFWLNRMRALGKPQTDVINGFLASPEYQSRFGNPDVPTFVTSLYRNVLGRAPDADGFAFWLNLLNTSQKTRPEVVQGFVTSVEFQATTLKQLYVEIAYFALLNRAAAPAELTVGKQAIASGQSGPTFLTPIVNGAEFLGRP